MTYAAIVKLARTLPGVEESTSFGTPSLKVKGKFMARLKEDSMTLVIKASFVVRDHLVRTASDVFFITDHYRDYPAVLVRIAKVDRNTIVQLLEDAWRDAAPKSLVRAFESQQNRQGA